MRKTLIYILLSLFSISSLPLQASMVLPSKDPDPKTVKAAIAEFKSLPKKERKERVKEAKKTFKEYKKNKRSGKAGDVDMIVLIILAILLPPLAVYLHQGEINTKFWLSILFWILFIIPGIIYALLVIHDKV